MIAMAVDIDDLNRRRRRRRRDEKVKTRTGSTMPSTTNCGNRAAGRSAWRSRQQNHVPHHMVGRLTCLGSHGHAGINMASMQMIWMLFWMLMDIASQNEREKEET